MKNILRLFFLHFTCCFLLSVVCFGQEIEWQNTIGGSGNDFLTAAQQTNDGGYVFGGYSSSNISGDKTENSIGGFDYWIVKTDSLCNIQWQNTIGGDLEDVPYYIRQTNDGGYILGGSSNSNISGDKTENSNGNYDYWIVKTDAIGNIQWQNTIGGNNMDLLYSMQQTSDGGYILGGYSESNISGDKTENKMGVGDYWIVKIDSTGNIQWQNTIGGDLSDNLSSIQQTSDGGYIIGGSSNSNISGDKTENNLDTNANCTQNCTYDYWIVKTDITGNIQWQKTIGGNSSESLTSIQQTIEGGYIIGGHSWSNTSGNKTENNWDLTMNTYDFWIVKTDSTGNIQWQNTIGGNNDDVLKSIQQTIDGGYIVGGETRSNISGDKTENYINYGNTNDYWIIKTDSNGNLKWQNTISALGEEYFSFIQQTIDGRYMLGGYSRSNISGDKTEYSHGSGDFWILKLNDKYNSISGYTFFDINSNTTQDVGEPSLINKPVTEQNTSRFAFTQQNGFYSVSVLDSGNYSVSPTAINYYNSVPANHSANFSGINQTDSLNDFAFQPTGTFNDLCITITPTGPFRSGFNASYVINYENIGTTTLSGDVIFFPWNNVTYVSSNVTPTSIALDSIVWSTGLLTPFQSGSITVTVNVNAGLPIGTLINSSVRIEPVAGDANPGCNYHSWEVYTAGSIDPNDILVNEDTLFTTQLPSQPWLDYTIRFQNTGNDTAFTVNVLNPIDTIKLELSSIEFVNSSHPVNLNWIPWERNMEFKFNNILLPDSNINEPLSHGFVHYRIKPKTTLLAGDSITNNAYIYFDFNAPVATNTAITRIVLPTGIAPLSWGEGPGVRCFPNPAKDEITITGYALQNNQPAVLKIYDVMGKEVFSQSIVNRTSQIVNLKSFTSGVYFVQLQTGVKVSRIKFVKQ